MGSVACYKFKVTKTGDDDQQQVWEFTKWWIKSYAVQTGSLHWSAAEDTLYIGFDDGSIQRLKILENGHFSEVSNSLGGD